MKIISTFLKLNSVVVYKSAGDNYWSAKSSTNPRCNISIRGCQLLIRGKNQNAQNRHKKGPKPKLFFARSSRYIDLTFYEIFFYHNPFKYKHILNWGAAYSNVCTTDSPTRRNRFKRKVL